MLVSEALEAWFRKYDLGPDGGLNQSWGRIKVGKIGIPIPNTNSRKKALVFHDIHHVATGYTGDWPGEVSISAWEISSGCGSFGVAWLLNFGGFMIGLFLFPKLVFRAFIRGRRTQNLYHGLLSKEAAMRMPVAELQEKLGLTNVDPSPATAKEIFAFAFWGLTSVLVSFTVFILPWVVLLCWIV